MAAAVAEFIDALTPEETVALAYDWPTWRRPSQVWPDCDPLIWMIVTGRGWGKTRVGSEAVRDWVRLGYKHIHLVGRTAADVRDTMVEGESGLLAVCAGDLGNAPVYNSSKRRIQWPNGARATLFSAEKPDALRGPQCVAADTQVWLGDGTTKPIVDIKVGDSVMTRRGPRKVVDAGLSARGVSVHALTTAAGVLCATAEHPVWVEGKGFTPISSLKKGMVLCAKTRSSSEARLSTGTSSGTTQQRFDCTGRSGRPLMGLFRKVLAYITPMAISPTTELRTLSFAPKASTPEGTFRTTLSHTESVGLGMRRRVGKGTEKRGCREILFASSVVGLIQAARSVRRLIAQGSVPRSFVQGRSAASGGDVSTVEMSTPQRSAFSATVVGRAATRLLKIGLVVFGCANFLVRSAAKLFGASASTRASVVSAVPWSTTLKIDAVEKLADKVDVYNLTVDVDNEFFANGVLVHNCERYWADEVAAWKYPQETWDMLQFGARLGANVRGLVTTTPRPIPLVKALIKNTDVHVTRGTTFENAENLSDTFLSQMRQIYSGTRLGRQELEGAVLDDNPNALWTRDLIEASRVAVVPKSLKTGKPSWQLVVVGVDPAASVGEDSNATGIVVAARDRRNPSHYYILEDATVEAATPEKWGQQVVAIYHKYGANWVVPEINQGGDMVRSTIRVVDPRVAVRPVRATRGKALRAEPISALYEQGKVHHVGSFPLLEDQLCEWEPYSNMDSPDRLDAMVWAVTALSEREGLVMPFSRKLIGV